MGAADDPRVARLDAVLERLAQHENAEVRGAVAELWSGIRWLHAEGLQRLTELLAEDPERFRRGLDDPQISNLLLLYDLVVVDERERALEALESMRPYMRGHGGEVELLEVEEGIVRIRLLGSCHGCPSSIATLRQGIERSLAERLPGFRGLEVRGEDLPAEAVGGATLDGQDHRAVRSRSGQPVSFVPVEKLTSLQGRASGDREEAVTEGTARDVEVGPLDALPSGVLQALMDDNYPILIVRSAGLVLAFQNTCPGSILPLHLGRLDDGLVTCPWHGCRYDVHSGERRDRPGRPLHRLDVRVELGQVIVTVR